MPATVSDNMTVDKLQQAFYLANHQRYELMAPNVFPDWMFNEMDIFALRKSGYLDEIEIKLTRSDFLNDFKKVVTLKNPEGRGYIKKGKHLALLAGEAHCNYFSFLMPEELAEKCEPDIPEHAGLYVCRYRGKRHTVHEVRPAMLLHKRKISDQMKYSVARKMAYRFWQYNKLTEVMA